MFFFNLLPALEVLEKPPAPMTPSMREKEGRHAVLCRLLPVLVIVIGLFLIPGCVTLETKTMNPLQAVDYVDLNRYVGTWYEIARFANRFQKNCAGSKATYTLGDDGRITVINECYDPSSGKQRSVKGKAWVKDRATNAKLRVSFFWPFAGDYWIIDLGREYEYAVVGHPKRKYLWVLSRSPEMARETYEGILKQLERQEYDTSKLIQTAQLR